MQTFREPRCGVPRPPGPGATSSVAHGKATVTVYLTWVGLFDVVLSFESGGGAREGICLG